MNVNDKIFDFLDIKDFSGMLLRKPFDREILFIAILESIIFSEDVSPASTNKAEIIKDKKLVEIQNNLVLLSEIKLSTMVYDFSNLNIKLFVRSFITITNKNNQKYVLNFPIKRYLQTGESKLIHLPDKETSAKI
jgi:hypothetical protein